MKINFDKIYCISYCRNIEKQNNIRKAMDYLGIDFEFIYGADYSNLKILKHKDFNFLTKDDFLEKQDFKYYTHFIGASYDHYTAVIHAYESGANSVLILEDDCTFINDTSYIQWVLNNYPKDADIVKFGYLDMNILSKNYDINIKNKFELEYNNIINFCGCQLYGICNRDTMKRYIDYQKNNFICCSSIYYSISSKIYSLIKPIALDGLAVKNHKDLYNEYNLIDF